MLPPHNENEQCKKSNICREGKNFLLRAFLRSFFRDKLKFFSHECWNISYLLILCKANFHFAGHGNKMPLYPMVNRFFAKFRNSVWQKLPYWHFGSIKFNPLTSANLIIASRFNHMKNYNVNSFVDTSITKKSSLHSISCHQPSKFICFNLKNVAFSSSIIFSRCWHAS